MVKKWVRPKSAPIAGVCGAAANAIGADPLVVRLIWLGAALFFGTGFCLYLVCWWFLPSEARQFDPDRPSFLGVCYRISQRTGVELSLVRIGVFLSFFVSMSITFWGYFIAHFLLPHQVETSSSSTPPTDKTEFNQA